MQALTKPPSWLATSRSLRLLTAATLFILLATSANAQDTSTAQDAAFRLRISGGSPRWSPGPWVSEGQELEVHWTVEESTYFAGIGKTDCSPEVCGTVLSIDGPSVPKTDVTLDIQPPVVGDVIFVYGGMGDLPDAQGEIFPPQTGWMDDSPPIQDESGCYRRFAITLRVREIEHSFYLRTGVDCPTGT